MKIKYSGLIIGLIFCLIAAVKVSQAGTDTSIPTVSCEKLNELMGDRTQRLTLVDVRGPFEFENEHIPGSKYHA